MTVMTTFQFVPLGTLEEIDRKIAELQEQRAAIIQQKRLEVTTRMAQHRRILGKAAQDIIVPITSKERTQRGQKYGGQPTGMVARIGLQDDVMSIHITGHYNNQQVDRTFKVGDIAEYDSFNLSYHGEIVKITDKRITIKPQYSRDRVKSMDLYSFAWRNYNFDLQKSMDDNAETRMGI